MTRKPAAKTSAANPSKSSAQSGGAKSPAEPRVVKVPTYRSFRLQKRIKHSDVPDLPTAGRLFSQALAIVRQNWKVLFGIALVYGVLNFVFVRGMSLGGDLSTVKQQTDTVLQSGGGRLAATVPLFSYLMSSVVNPGSSSAAEGYQLILTLMVSLAVIWALRHIYAKEAVSIRNAFYKGMTPLVPFTLVLCVVGLQLIPFAVGVMLYANVISSGAVTVLVEHVLWGLLCAVLALVSLYMTTSSVLALYIVTLPDMTPLKALRSARKLVRNRRWMIMRKVLFLPVGLLLAGALIILPLIMFATPLAPIVFFVLVTLAVALVHSYMFNLYRSLL